MLCSEKQANGSIQGGYRQHQSILPPIINSRFTHHGPNPSWIDYISDLKYFLGSKLSECSPMLPNKRAFPPLSATSQMCWLGLQAHSNTVGLQATSVTLQGERDKMGRRGRRSLQHWSLVAGLSFSSGPARSPKLFPLEFLFWIRVSYTDTVHSCPHDSLSRA